jgi:hypothetical protein
VRPPRTLRLLTIEFGRAGVAEEDPQDHHEARAQGTPGRFSSSERSTHPLHVQLVDYDRHNNSYNKLKDKKEKSLSDEKNLFKYEQELEIATQEYEHYNK